MGFQVNGTETYVYLNGIKPRTKIELEEGLIFAPSACNPSPDEIISKSKSEIDIGIACVFLRSVSSHFHISAETPKELIVKVWNSQWVAVLLSALFDREVGHNFQADVTPENFSNANQFLVTNYAFKGLNSEPTKTLTKAEHNWLEHHYLSSKKMLDNERYQNAVHCLASYRWHSMPRAQLALIWSGIEGLFGIDHELSFRLSLCIAKYLSPQSRSRQKGIFNEIKKLYTVRSKAVHGSKIKEPQEAVSQSVSILRKLVKKCSEKGEIPQTNEIIP